MLKVYFILLLCIMAFRVSSREMGTGGSNHLSESRKLECRSERTVGLVDTIKNPDGINSNRKPGFNSMSRIKGSNTADLFVRVYTSKMDCFVGEPILATYKLYSRVNSKSTITRQPSLQGFRVFDLFEIIPIAASTETVSGIPYQVHTIRNAQLVPLQTGNLQVDPIELANRVHYTPNGTKGRTDSIHLDEMLNGLLEEESGPSEERLVSVKSKPVNVRVKALPELDRPATFSGAVGRFTIKAGLGFGSLVVNDVNTLSIELSGIGYWSITDAPGIQWPSDIEGIGVEWTSTPDPNGNPLEGKTVFTYSFVPKRAGKFVIPAVKFTFFETNTGGYKTIESTPLPFEAGVMTNIAKAGRKVQGIVKANTGDITVVSPSFLSIGISMALLVILIFGFLLRKRLSFYLTNTEKNRPHETLIEKGEVINGQPMPADPLQDARMLVDTSSYKDFYTTLHSVLWKQLRDKLALPQTVLNKTNVSEKLESFGWSKEMTRTLDIVLTECERIVYLPEYKPQVNRMDLLDIAEILIMQLNYTSMVPEMNVQR